MDLPAKIAPARYTRLTLKESTSSFALSKKKRLDVSCKITHECTTHVVSKAKIKMIGHFQNDENEARDYPKTSISLVHPAPSNEVNRCLVAGAERRRLLHRNATATIQR